MERHQQTIDIKAQIILEHFIPQVVNTKKLKGLAKEMVITQNIETAIRYYKAMARLLGEKTEDLFILDFLNSVEDIKDAFDPFYTATSLSRATDVNVLHELKEVLDVVGVYEWQEVEDFVERYFSNADAQSLSPIIDTAAARFNKDLSLEEADIILRKKSCTQFVSS